MRALEWKSGKVRFIDQTQLPNNTEIIETENYLDIVEAIKKLGIRGAPLIGIAAAFGIYLAVQRIPDENKTEFVSKFRTASADLAATRPTAVNLFWAIEKMNKVFEDSKGLSVSEIQNKLLEEALRIQREDIENCDLIGQFGNTLIPNEATIITHCNAGFLAVGGDGSALSPVYKAFESGKKIQVFADETRPLLQGARLTTWELNNRGVKVTLITDNTAAFAMKKFKIDLAIVGADRIASNGDVANKIGTYNLAIIANKHNVPFYVAAPVSTFDFSINSGDEIPIEERDPSEVTIPFGRRIAPEGINVYSPAFDVTPNNLITGIITEKGILRPPYKESILRLKNL